MSKDKKIKGKIRIELVKNGKLIDGAYLKWLPEKTEIKKITFDIELLRVNIFGENKRIYAKIKKYKDIKAEWK